MQITERKWIKQNALKDSLQLTTLASSPGAEFWLSFVSKSTNNFLKRELARLSSSRTTSFVRWMRSGRTFGDRGLLTKMCYKYKHKLWLKIFGDIGLLTKICYNISKKVKFKTFGCQGLYIGNYVENRIQLLSSIMLLRLGSGRTNNKTCPQAVDDVETILGALG